MWAAYDDEDSMPRYYAFIHSVISKNPFQVKITWLSSKTNDEFATIKWAGSGFPKTIEDHQLGKRAISSTLNSFSHRVKWTKGSKGVFHIYRQRKGMFGTQHELNYILRSKFTIIQSKDGNENQNWKNKILQRSPLH